MLYEVITVLAFGKEHVFSRAGSGTHSIAGWIRFFELCLQLSIMLVDDILDDDPRGFQIDKGPGWAANLALALQSAAVRLVAMNHRDASTVITSYSIHYTKLYEAPDTAAELQVTVRALL